LRIVRSVLLALLASLVAGLVIGTVIRLRLEHTEQRYFIGARAPEAGSSVPARLPGDVVDVRAMVLHAGHHEEQVG
jgi:hypothetical protein